MPFHHFHKTSKRPIVRAPSRNSRSQQRNCRTGATTIEMAMVAPFVFFLIFASVEFSRMMMIKQALTNAAREGARRASLVTAQNSDVADAVVRDMLGPTMQHADDPDILFVKFDYPNGSNAQSGDRITAQVSVNCSDVSWAAGPFFGQARISSMASMVRE